MANHNTAHPTAFHGWKILFLATFGQLVSVGFTVYLLGLYFEPLAQAFATTTGQLGWASSVFLLVAAGLGPVLGYWVDRGKVKILMTLGAVALSLGFMLLSVCSNLIEATLTCIFLIAPGSAMIGLVTAGAMLSQWFERRRGLALGIAAAGMSLGGFLMPPIAAFLFETFNWRIGSFIFGLFILLTLTPCAWFIAVATPAEVGQYPDGVQPGIRPATHQQTRTGETFLALLARLDFWLIAVTVGTLSFASISFITYLVPFSRELGIDLQKSAFMLSLYAGTAFFGKFLYGWLADKFSPAKLMTSVSTVMALGLLPMLYFKSLIFVVASIAVVGIGVGGLMPIWASIVAKNFGPQAFGKVKGAMSLVLTSVSVIPGPLGGYIHDWKGSYAMTFTVVLWVLIFGLVVSLLIPTKPSTPAGFASPKITP
ncbi:MFS transporter [Halioxenophilus sp. WMMB6]|uniref:MFS transporter n=1 Tax=Halioxenophilus sp. WMMB6 TaxID=3073815 RepID=UPI00295EF7CD|nr:MFS transporter [Halioxenophilus sp. WMMB6]